ncbi:hypothetical protein NBRC116493_19970 [Aurantivibrio infirmus]
MKNTDDLSSDELVTTFHEDADIYRIVRAMQSEHSLLSVEFQRLEKLYTSIIVSCDPKRGVFHIDKLHPSDGNHLLFQNHEFSIIGLCNGVPAILSGCQIDTQTEAAIPSILAGNKGIALHFPRTITYQQRRQSFRTLVPRILGAKISYTLPDSDAPISGRLLDLSNTGFGCEFSIDKKATLKKGMTIKNCSIEIPEMLNINCSIEIMNARKVNKNPLVRCGIIFTDLSDKNERLITKCVLQLQQKLRRTETLKDGFK